MSTRLMSSVKLNLRFKVTVPVFPWAMHKYASVYLLEAELFSTRQTKILAILASSETINI